MVHTFSYRAQQPFIHMDGVTAQNYFLRFFINLFKYSNAESIYCN